MQRAEKELEKVTIEDEVTEEICEECGRNMVIKYGPYGKFLACPGFPECRNTKPYYEKIGVACPKCGKNEGIKKVNQTAPFYMAFSEWEPMGNEVSYNRQVSVARRFRELMKEKRGVDM